MPSRRRFLKHSLLAGGAVAGSLAVPGAERLLADASSEASAHGLLRGPSPRPGLRSSPARRLRILVLGGTGFIGPHLVHRILERGHELTLFNRGRSEPGMYEDLYRDVETRVGDRNSDLAALETGTWDAVIDNSGYTPDQVGATARLLAGRVGRYVFTSTRAVYRDFTHPVMDEDAPVGPDAPEAEWAGYGPLKALAEREVEAAFPRGTSIVRPPIITGPGDNTDRFTFWYVRVDRGGEVLAPGDPSDPIQYVDVRDLVDFMVLLAEEGIDGTFNVEAPAAPLSSAGFLYGLRATTGSPVDFTWVPWDFLEGHGLRGGAEIPAWRAPEGAWLNYGRMDNRRAMAAGMTFRPLAVTAMDTLAWWKEKAAREGDGMRAGFSRDRESEILRAWRGQRRG
jgi:2'-hydroxyisoflavone reductase